MQLETTSHHLGQWPAAEETSLVNAAGARDGRRMVRCPLPVISRLRFLRARERFHPTLRPCGRCKLVAPRAHDRRARRRRSARSRLSVCWMTPYRSLASVRPTVARVVSAVRTHTCGSECADDGPGKDLKGDDERTLIDPDVVRDV